MSNNRPKLDFCSMFRYDVAMAFVYEFVYYKIAYKAFMINENRWHEVVVGCLN